MDHIEKRCNARIRGAAIYSCDTGRFCGKDGDRHGEPGQVTIPSTPALPRFDNGMLNLQELVRLFAEVLASQTIDAKVDQLCGGEANSKKGYRERGLDTRVGRILLRIPSPLPRWHRRALPARRPCPGRGRRRDVRDRHKHLKGPEGRQAYERHWHVQ